METTTRWILVAHRGGARIYESRGAGMPWLVLHDEAHPEGRAKAEELSDDQRGQVFESSAHGQRPMEPSTDPTEVVAKRYARELADKLIRGRQEGRYDGLALVAAPSFLGKLRSALDAPTRRTVEAEKAMVVPDPAPKKVRSALRSMILV